MGKGVVLLCFLLCCGAAFPEQPCVEDSKAIPFNGLTGTISGLLGSKPTVRIPVGSCYLNPEDFLESGIDQIYDCDDPVNKYLTENDECYYGQLAEIIKERINDNIRDKSACVYVIVDATEDGNIATISIAASYNKNAILPVYIDSANSELKLSLVLPCSIEYNASFSIEVDSEKVNSGDNLEGTSIRVDNYEISIKSYEDDWEQAATMVYNNALYELPLHEHSIDASINWMLRSGGGHDEESPRITYEQLSTGDFEWDVESMSDISFSGKASGRALDEDERLEVSVTIDASTSAEDRKVEVTDEEGTRDLAIRQLEL
jgi:hypothetical protein